MDKRKFIKIAGVITAGSVILPYFSCNPPSGENKEVKDDENTLSDGGAFTLPALTYPFNALEPNIDARTMEIHHDKHHAGYVSKLNAALENSPLKGKKLEDILASVGEADTAVRNNGGGHFNHSMFWESLSPKGGGSPSGKVSDAINGTFGSFAQFQEAFSKAATSVFGSGWAWLCKGEDGKLLITSTPNQDNPLMTNLVAQKGVPILGLDVWEHAYYLKYQNRRGEYVQNFFNLINWDKVSSRL